MSMYIRLKRKLTTIFMHVEPSDTFKSIKHRAAEIIKEDESRVGLFSAMDKGKELADLASISDQEIQNDQIIYILLKAPAGGQWEDFDVKVWDEEEKDG